MRTKTVLGARCSVPGLGRTRVAALLLFAGLASGETVGTAQEFRSAVAKAKPGTTILLKPGDYGGGFSFADVKGDEKRPIVIAAADPADPPVFRGSACALHFTDAAHLELRDLVVVGATGNGINCDDGGTFETPSHHLTFRRLKITDVGDRGNQDGLKLSGIQDLRVEDCTFERWGRNGSAIDMVGCTRGVVEGCAFTHETGSNAVQMKGGTAEIKVRKCAFTHAGSRAVNIGGSTGLQYFRPPIPDGGKAGGNFAEARDIVVEGCTFVGSDSPVAFVGVDGASVRYNTIYRPKRWAIRILQETKAEGFVACRGGWFTHNIVVFRSDEWSEGGINVGPGTEAKSFAFEGNAWFCLDAPERSSPRLPSTEKNGLLGKDPLFEAAEKGDFRLKKGSPMGPRGFEALPK